MRDDVTVLTGVPTRVLKVRGKEPMRVEWMWRE